MTTTTSNLNQNNSQPADQLASLPITHLKGVGAKFAQVLEKLGLKTVQDVLFHLPFRYVDKTRITPIFNLVVNHTAVIQGTVASNNVQFGKRRSLHVTVEDDSGRVNLRFFHFTAAQKNNLSVGTPIRCYGEPRLGATGLEMYHPEITTLHSMDDTPEDSALTPVYHLTEGLSQPRLIKLTEQAVNYLKKTPPTEHLPPQVAQKFGVSSLGDALAFLHFPPPDANIEQMLEGMHPYQQRLAFEELLAHFLARQEARMLAQKDQSPVIHIHKKQRAAFLARLPFTPTGAQTRVLHSINVDLAQQKPMLRMVQGDVGSGKTLVAAMAALDVVAAGYQVAMVAPTEILSEQHFHAFCRWFEPLGFKALWLVGKLTPAQKRKALEKIISHEVDIVIGTHALFEDKVQFAKLALCIIDEQHRFGVNQRLTLREKSADGLTPHQLVMTATPIPRTLAMTAYAELDYSVIDELPPGRTPINTVLISQNRRPQIIERIRAACQEGKQVYWVCTLVEDSETLDAANAEETAETLQACLPELHVGLIHGRLKAAEKQSVMNTFKQGESHLLVATTVIEVGVDVPNASLMIIENPERLGLSQLHQLRGRVGRGTVASHCVMLYGDKLSRQAKERLNVMRETNDGFEIAQKDLELRGPGELLGTRQTGDMLYRVADLNRDGYLLDDIHHIGQQLLEQNTPAVEAILNRWFGAKRLYMNV